ncbi:GNAT family N-acetyltransferase [Heyndrickxia sp. NPDC080065]|uniref:GNAT family N-acetyltransferase n=1 Tax=Heyndrickxia sp. NPDC080065 TaxID=3390568 RepID=UPI003CFF6333
MSSNISLQPISDLTAAAIFIAEYNSHTRHHVGYCGDQWKEILYTLQNHFSDLPKRESIIGAYDNNELIGVLGLDVDKESKEAEIWGPFIKCSNWDEVAQGMWSELLRRMSIKVVRFHGFYNKNNQHAARFMKQLGFVKGGNHNILCAKPFHQNDCQNLHLQEISPDLYQSFILLHQQLFPETYYDGSTILNRLNDQRKVIVANNNGQLQGYVYFEANPEYKEGSIEFIGVSPDHRKKGIGRNLIKAALNQLFYKFQINEIQLCVDADNEKALKLYMSAGFINKHEVIYYAK